MNREISPPSLPPPAARYAHAVAVDQPDRWLFTSGVVPTRRDGTTPDAIGDQAEVVWRNIAELLGDARMEVSDIVNVTTYAVAGEELAPVMAARDRFFGEHRAASTLVTVPALAQPQWKVEISVVAAR